MPIFALMNPANLWPQGQVSGYCFYICQKKHFEKNLFAVEVLIFKGRKRISIDRFKATNDDFFSKFKKAYER